MEIGAGGYAPFRAVLCSNKSAVSGLDGGPLQVENLSDLDIARRIGFVLELGERELLSQKGKEP